MKMNKTTEEKSVFISVPMNGKDEALIKRSIQLTKRAYCRRNKVSARDIFFYDNFNWLKEFERIQGVNIISDNVIHPRVTYLSYGLCGLSYCDEAVFGKGWKDAKGCCIEHEVCERYGIPIMDLEKKIKKARS